jgi:hypothetical protein
VIELLSQSDLHSRYFQSVAQGLTVRAGRLTRPAETNSHLVISKGPQHTLAYFVGPWDSSTELQVESDVHIMWIKLKLGVHVKRTPSLVFQNAEHIINPSSSQELALYGQTFRIPTERGIDGFLAHLEKSGVLDFDPVVAESLENSAVKMPERTLRYRFLSSVGISRASIFQIQRIKQAALLVSQGVELTEIALSLGFYDQSHLTRNFKKYLGVTPGMSHHAQRELR